MFKNIRRNSKQLFEGRRKSSFATVTSIDSIRAETKPRTLTFFDLPAEIRNAIYEDVARDTNILVAPPGKKSEKSPPPIPSLLVTSGKTRQEFMPMLLEFAHIAFTVKQFDFRNLMRIVSSLYSTELKALRNNASLTIRIQVEQKCRRDELQALQRWLVNRADGLDRLSWHYTLTWAKNNQLIPTSTQVHQINTYIQRRTILGQNIDAMAQLHKNVVEALRFELDPIIAAFESELSRVFRSGLTVSEGYQSAQSLFYQDSEWR